jgi:hypothetical protein
MMKKAVPAVVVAWRTIFLLGQAPRIGTAAFVLLNRIRPVNPS